MKIALLILLACSKLFSIETLGFRNEKAAADAKALPFDKEVRELYVEEMKGPFADAKTACPSCTSIMVADPPYDRIATSDDMVAVRIHGTWWTAPALLTPTCKHTFDGIVRDILKSAKGPELYLHSIEECPKPPHWGPNDHEESELVQICGIGKSGTPSCAQLQFGMSSLSPDYSQHEQLELRCDGSGTSTYWEGDGHGGFITMHTKVHVELK